MEREQIWADMAKIMGDIVEETVEWKEEWLPDRQEPDEPPGAWKVQFTFPCSPDGTEIGGYIIVTPGLLYRAVGPPKSGRERERILAGSNMFQYVARQFGDAARASLNKDTRMDEMRAEIAHLAPA